METLSPRAQYPAPPPGSAWAFSYFSCASRHSLESPDFLPSFSRFSMHSKMAADPVDFEQYWPISLPQLFHSVGTSACAATTHIPATVPAIIDFVTMSQSSDNVVLFNNATTARV